MKTTKEILREVRHILKTPEGEDIIKYSQKIMSKKEQFLLELKFIISDFHRTNESRLDDIAVLIEKQHF